MAKEKTIVDIPRVILTNEVNKYLAIYDVISLCKSAKHFSMFKPELDKRTTKAFLQAVIDDNRQTVKRMLDAKPNLLLSNPRIEPTLKNLEIESKLSWQRFIPEKAATMAAKRRQIKMLELMLPYFDKLEQTEKVKLAKSEALEAWNVYETYKNAEHVDTIAIPEHYTGYIENLVKLFCAEYFIDGKLNESTESALSALFVDLLPEKAKKCDEYFDIELLLLAAYRTYLNKYDSFNTKEQRNGFCIRVMGFIQSILSPETAKILCESLNDFVIKTGEGKEFTISGRAETLTLKEGQSYYRANRNSKKGLGFDFICGFLGRIFRLDGQHFGSSHFEKLYSVKIASFEKLWSEGIITKHAFKTL